MNDKRLIATRPNLIHEEFPEHDWIKDENGKIDEFVLDSGFHNGPGCRRCGYMFCMHCNPDGYTSRPCIIHHYECPNCGRNITPLDRFCSQCGQALLWDKI